MPGEKKPFWVKSACIDEKVIKIFALLYLNKNPLLLTGPIISTLA